MRGWNAVAVKIQEGEVKWTLWYMTKSILQYYGKNVVFCVDLENSQPLSLSLNFFNYKNKYLERSPFEGGRTLVRLQYGIQKMHANTRRCCTSRTTEETHVDFLLTRH